MILAYPDACIYSLLRSLLVSCISHYGIVDIVITVMFFYRITLCQHLYVVLLSVYPDLVDILSSGTEYVPGKSILLWHRGARPLFGILFFIGKSLINAEDVDSWVLLVILITLILLQRDHLIHVYLILSHREGGLHLILLRPVALDGLLYQLSLLV